MMAADEAEQELELVELPYPFVESDEQKLRCFIAEHYLNAEIDGTILIENMDRIFSWVKDGKIPAKAKGRPALHAVKPDA